MGIERSSGIERRSLLAAGATGFVALIGGCGAAAAEPRTGSTPRAAAWAWSSATACWDAP